MEEPISQETDTSLSSEVSDDTIVGSEKARKRMGLALVVLHDNMRKGLESGKGNTQVCDMHLQSRLTQLRDEHESGVQANVNWAQEARVMAELLRNTGLSMAPQGVSQGSVSMAPVGNVNAMKVSLAPGESANSGLVSMAPTSSNGNIGLSVAPVSVENVAMVSVAPEVNVNSEGSSVASNDGLVAMMSVGSRSRQRKPVHLYKSTKTIHTYHRERRGPRDSPRLPIMTSEGRVKFLVDSGAVASFIGKKIRNSERFRDHEIPEEFIAANDMGLTLYGSSG